MTAVRVPSLDRCTRCGQPLQMDLVGVTRCRRCVRAAHADVLRRLLQTPTPRRFEPDPVDSGAQVAR